MMKLSINQMKKKNKKKSNKKWKNEKIMKILMKKI